MRTLACLLPWSTERVSSTGSRLRTRSVLVSKCLLLQIAVFVRFMPTLHRLHYHVRLTRDQHVRAADVQLVQHAEFAKQSNTSRIARVFDERCRFNANVTQRISCH